MPDQRTKPSKVFVEDLLRLKRNERPAPEFWTEFERTLRQRQLAALVEKRSWWHNLAGGYGRLFRVGLPLGAAAILAVTFLSSRTQFRTPKDLNTAADERPAGRRPSPMPSPSTSAGNTEDRIAAMAPSRPQAADESPSSVSGKSTTLAAATTVGASRQTVMPISWLDDVLDDRAGRPELTPSARAITADLATVSTVEPELLDAVARPLGFEERAMPVAHLQHTAEMLPTAAAVTEPRRAHLLASLGSAGIYSPEPSAPEHARRSVLRYLAEDGWDRSMSRLEAEGDKLSIKF